MLSPDGRFIAFAEPDNGAARDLHIVRVDGTRRHRVTEHAADDSTPMWSPDGRHLAFISNRAGSAALWAVAIEAGEPVGMPFEIKDGIGFASPLNWNTRGIVFSEAMPTFDVFTSERVDSTAGRWGTPRLVPYESTGGNFAPKWTPSGSHLAFIARDAVQWSRRHVIVKPVDGGVGREYLVPDTPLSPGFADLRWFGNGKGLGLVGAGSHGGPAVYRLTLASGEWAVVPLNTKTWAPIEWNDDGSACYLVRMGPGVTGIYERVLETARERPVYRPTQPLVRRLHKTAI